MRRNGVLPRLVLCTVLLAALLAGRIGGAAERLVAASWRVRAEMIMGKGPVGWVVVAEWLPLLFFRNHRTAFDPLGYVPEPTWKTLATPAETREVGTIDGFVCIEVITKDYLAPIPGYDAHLLLAGPDTQRLRPLHILHTGDGIVARVAPAAIIDVGGQAAVSFKYYYSGNAAVSAEYIYRVHDGRPTDIEIWRTQFHGPLPAFLAADWERWVPQRKTDSPPPGDGRAAIDLKTLRGSIYLLSKHTGAGQWFDVEYGLPNGVLEILRATPAAAP